ncbi:MAG: hypothetical protein IJC35_01915 [Oscillospiraceae bacterium]|nr:hypothetical protein [Oscillospiraceae bacterium]
MGRVYANVYEGILTRKCTCGGTGRVLMDFAQGFAVYCDKCHAATRPFVGLGAAAAHWNSGDGIFVRV